MANDFGDNPLRCDTAATVISDATGETWVQAMQWLDSDTAAGGVIADTEHLTMTVNSVTIDINIEDVNTQLSGAVAWSVEFSVPIRVTSLVVSAIDGGILYVWTA